MPVPYADRVAKGAALLDQARPGWWQEIEADRLEMESCDKCVLGQLYGHYRAGFREILVSQPGTQLFSAADHGFTLHGKEQEYVDADSYHAVDDRFAALADAWRAEIRRRRSE